MQSSFSDKLFKESSTLIPRACCIETSSLTTSCSLRKEKLRSATSVLANSFRTKTKSKQNSAVLLPILRQRCSKERDTKVFNLIFGVRELCSMPCSLELCRSRPLTFLSCNSRLSICSAVGEIPEKYQRLRWLSSRKFLKLILIWDWPQFKSYLTHGCRWLRLKSTKLRFFRTKKNKK